MRAFMIEASRFDTDDLLRCWRWRVSPELKPQMISLFGDWVFGAPDGTIWALSLLEGECGQIARSSAEYNILKRDFDWMSEVFIADWQEIAERHRIIPADDQCIGWKVHPMLGGAFSVDNMKIQSMSSYQPFMGEFHRQIRQPARK
jgi:hypothetical protein